MFIINANNWKSRVFSGSHFSINLSKEELSKLPEGNPKIKIFLKDCNFQPFSFDDGEDKVFGSIIDWHDGTFHVVLEGNHDLDKYTRFLTVSGEKTWEELIKELG